MFLDVNHSNLGGVALGHVGVNQCQQDYAARCDFQEREHWQILPDPTSKSGSFNCTDGALQYCRLISSRHRLLLRFSQAFLAGMRTLEVPELVEHSKNNADGAAGLLTGPAGVVRH